MHFTIGLIINNKQLSTKEFELQKAIDCKIINLDQIRTNKLSILLYLEDLAHDDILETLKEEHQFYPVINANTFNITKESFENLDYQTAKQILDDSYDQWLVQNSLGIIEDIFLTINHLKSIWPNNRSDFFEELWFILKRALGTTSLKVIFNHINISENTNIKNKLVLCTIEGNRLPEPKEGTEFEKTIMENYRTQTSEIFQITDFDKSQGKIVMAGNIKDSPIIIMAELFQFGMLQKSLLKALFDGLQTI